MIVALLLSCTAPKQHRPIPLDATDDTGPSTSVPPQTTGGPDTWPWIAPSVRILDSSDLELSLFVALVPAHGADPGLILASGWSDAFGDPRYVPSPTVVLPGNLPPGDHLAAEVWDGVTRIDEFWPWDAVVNAGDVDRDGHLDLWYGHLLIRGPLLKGRAVLTEDVLATLDELAVAGNVDVDGDGELDVIAMRGSSQQAFVRFGPFAGSIPSAEDGVADPSTYSSFGESNGCSVLPVAQWLRDHLGPGHDAIALGSDNELCSVDVYVWDPFVPRGTHLRYSDALAEVFDFQDHRFDVFLHDPGDVDRDGHPDAIFEYGGFAQLIPGPLAGEYSGFNDLGFLEQVLNGFPGRAMPDVNGDGAPEILGRWRWTDPSLPASSYTRDTWVLLCSPFTFPLDMATGLPLVAARGNIGYFGSYIGLDSVDLDGDGLPDLVDSSAGDEPGDALQVWYGKDLAAACDAHSTSTTATR